jgi:hypothetical protein
LMLALEVQLEFDHDVDQPCLDFNLGKRNQLSFAIQNLIHLINLKETYSVLAAISVV